MSAALVVAFATFQCLFLAAGSSEVQELRGSPDYRYVALKWEYDMAAPRPYGFQVHYCELQAWGLHRCKVKSLDIGAVNNAVSRSGRARVYSVIVPGLRMATNYSFEVRPITGHRMDREFHDFSTGKTVVVATKGFSAKASLCLPQESEIEVSTGPYFAGRIAVEAADGERCVVDGDANSPRDVYTLRISHAACGSTVNETTVATFVLVQENLPILTHSTRRFLVLCTYQPDTLTVRAKLSLPSGPSHEDERRHGNRVDVELQDHVQVMRLQQPQEHSAQMDDSPQVVTVEPVAQLVLMMVLIVAAVGGLFLVVWWSLRRRSKAGNMSDAESTTYSDDSLRETEPSEIDFEIESVCGSNSSYPHSHHGHLVSNTSNHM